VNIDKEKDMKKVRLRCLSLTLVFALTAIAGPPHQDCIINADSALLAPLRHPYTATHVEWTAAARTFAAIARACPSGPADPKSRERLFAYIDSKLSLDYDRLCAIWTKGNYGSGDGCVNEEEHSDLRAYLDKIVDPARDSAETAMILKHGNGLAISKFGPTVKSRVIEMASAPQPTEPFHDPQIEAFRALGFWLLPSESKFTADEKAELTTLLLNALPPADKVAGGRETAMTRAILQSLGNSTNPAVARTLRTWANLNQSTRSYPSSLAANARTAAAAVGKHAEQDR
jgi:hypothetical protein